jgi:hypothetical protein
LPMAHECWCHVRRVLISSQESGFSRTNYVQMALLTQG